MILKIEYFLIDRSKNQTATYEIKLKCDDSQSCTYKIFELKFAN